MTYYGQSLGWQRYFTYDAENQLVTVEVPGYYKSTFTYDGRGRRRQRTEYTWNGSNWVFAQTINYIYDGMRVIQERDNNGNAPLVSYTRGSDLSGTFEGAGGIGGLLARSHGYSSGTFTNHNFYHADGNGNITYMVNSSQSLAASYRYDPFGNTISSSGTLASVNLYRFSSKEVDPNYTDSGLYYYGYRFYDPNLQRWLNRDPIQEAGGINLYRFVENDPLGRFDPYGLMDPLGDQASLWHKWQETMKQIDLLDRTKACRKLTPAEQKQLEDLIKQSRDVADKLNKLRGTGGFANGRLLARGGAVVAAGVAGYAGGRALGNSTPYEGGGTIDENVQQAIFIPFWDWWFGNKAK